MSENDAGAQDIPEKKISILCAPVLTFTQADADHVSGLCPIQYVDGKSNIVIVVPALSKEMINDRKGQLHIVHLIKDLVTDEEKVVGEWQISVPIDQTINKNIFYVKLTP